SPNHFAIAKDLLLTETGAPAVLELAAALVPPLLHECGIGVTDALSARARMVEPRSDSFSCLLPPLDPLFFGFLPDNVVLDDHRLGAPLLKSSKLDEHLLHGFGRLL